MGKIIVCNTKTAQNPYTFLNTKVSVYSYEELCYYLYNNMVLVGGRRCDGEIVGMD